MKWKKKKWKVAKLTNERISEKTNERTNKWMKGHQSNERKKKT